MKENTSETVVTTYRNYHGGYFKTLISPQQTNGSFALIEMVLPNGSEPPIHTHTHEDETFYVLDGAMQFQIGPEIIDLEPGHAVFAPRMVPHLFKIIGAEARFLTLISPGNFWNYFIEFSEPTAGQPLVTPLQGPPTQEYINRIIDQMTNVYGISL